MEYVKLRDVCDKATSKYVQKNLEELQGDFPIYGASGLIKFINSYDQDKKYVAVVKDGAGVGKTMLLPEKSSVIGTLQYLIPKENIMTEYLYYAVKHMHLEKYYTGATIPHIYFKDYGNEKLHFYNKEKQKQIVNVLQSIENIIEKRKNEKLLLEDIIKARFVEMFGDPEINPMGWNVVSIGDVLSNSEAGWSGNGKQREKQPGEIAVLKVSSVTKGYFIPEECKILDDQDNIKKYVFPHKGDILFSRANTRDMVGATAIIDKDYIEHILPDKLWRITFNKDCDVYYMKCILSSRSIRDRFSAESTGTSGSMYNVSMAKFRDVRIPLPPIQLQNEFAEFIKQIDKSKIAS